MTLRKTISARSLSSQSGISISGQYPEPTHDSIGATGSGGSSYDRDRSTESIGDQLVAGLTLLLIIITFPISIGFCIKYTMEYERAIIFRLGKVRRTGPSGPGIFLINCFIDTYKVVGLRLSVFNIPPQDLLTKDSLTAVIDAVVFCRIADPLRSVIVVEDSEDATKLLAATALRGALASKTLSEILRSRETIAVDICAIMREATRRWGILVERVEIKDVRIPVEMQRSMAVEAETTRTANAKLIESRGEKKAASKLRRAAKMLDLSTHSMRLRYMQSLLSISSDQDSTILFPIPINIFGDITRMNEDYAAARASPVATATKEDLPGHKCRFPSTDEESTLSSIAYSSSSRESLESTASANA